MDFKQKNQQYIQSSGLLLSILILAPCLLIAACSHNHIVYTGLSGEGILPLSEHSPYEGANIFLAKEMERSIYLHEFIKRQGAPAAIEITEGRSRPTKVILYYPREKNVYTMVPYSPKLDVREWIIRGPFPIERLDYRAVLQHQKRLKSEPLFLVWGKEQRYKAGLPHDVQRRHVLLAKIPPTPKPKPKKKKKVTRTKKTKTIPSSPPPPKLKNLATKAQIADYGPFNSDQLAIRAAQGYSKRDDNGDLLHLVRSTKESLKNVTKWYTLSETNASKVADYNQIDPKQALKIGTELRIPINLLKRVLKPDSL